MSVIVGSMLTVRKMLKPVLGFVVAVLMSGCAPADLLNALVPEDTYQLTKDIAYGEIERQRLDIYKPVSMSVVPTPVVIFFYGGAWTAGARADYMFVGEALAAMGVLGVVADYRLHPDTKFPGFVEDAAQAVAWVRANINQYGGDPDKIVVMGHSAGAHIAALTLLDQHYLAEAGLPGDTIKGFVGLAGPYAFDPLAYRTSRPVFEHLSDPNVARPVTFVRGEVPPMLILHGEDDTTVGPYNSMDMTAELEKVHAPVQLKMYPDMGHVGIVVGLAEPFRKADGVFTDVSLFLKTLFKPVSSEPVG